MLKLPFYGPIRHMKRIGEIEDHKALRQRNEKRLAALKAANRLTEAAHVKPTSARYLTCAERAAIAVKQSELHSSIQQSAFFGAASQQLATIFGGTGYSPGSSLARALGIDSDQF